MFSRDSISHRHSREAVNKLIAFIIKRKYKTRVRVQVTRKTQLWLDLRSKKLKSWVCCLQDTSNYTTRSHFSIEYNRMNRSKYSTTTANSTLLINSHTKINQSGITHTKDLAVNPLVACIPCSHYVIIFTKYTKVIHRCEAASDSILIWTMKKTPLTLFHPNFSDTGNGLGIRQSHAGVVATVTRTLCQQRSVLSDPH